MKDLAKALRRKQGLILLDGGGCELCGSKEGRIEQHHIINKGSTRRGSEARKLSDAQELCAWLCPACHEKSHNPASQVILLDIRAKKYTPQAVYAALSAVQRAMRFTDLPIGALEWIENYKGGEDWTTQIPE